MRWPFVVACVLSIFWTRRHTPSPSVAVFCGHGTFDEAIHATGYELGRGIARCGWRLVYGGGTSGLMGTVRRGVLRENGTIMGITVPEYATGTVGDVVVQTLEERKGRLLRESDHVIVLPGNIGTIDEWMHALVQRVDKLGTPPPITVVNVNEYWTTLLSALPPHVRLHMTVVSTLSDVLDRLNIPCQNPVPFL